MTLGALIDLGVPIKRLQEDLSHIPLDGFEIKETIVARNGIRACDISVELKGEAVSRNLTDIRTLIQKSPLSENVKTMSLKCFQRLAAAEAEIHGCSIEHVHFHEVGAVDAIVDIVGSMICIERLGITRVLSSKIPLGKGFVSCMHGRLPVPAPATMALLKDVPVYGMDVEQELVTPTGAAIITTLAESFEKIPGMKIDTVGYGAGKKRRAEPNLLRVIMGRLLEDDSDGYNSETVWVVEACIDDMNPEIYGFLMERLFEDGALDVVWIPVFVKKNRPGTLIQILCKKTEKKKIVRRILSETTSTGLRFYEVGRSTLKRESVKVKTCYGEIPVKRVVDYNGDIRDVAEYEICRKIALERDIPIRVVYNNIMKSLE